MADHFDFDVFLSYSHADQPRVLRLAERLREAGIRVWLDEWCLEVGEHIHLGLERGQAASRALVMCLSPASLGSNWVQYERSTVLFRDPTNADRRFIPLLIEDCELPDALAAYKHLDYRDDGDAAFRQLVACCRPEDTLEFVQFTYPDPNDRITLATIGALEPERGYWSRSEDVMRRDFVEPMLAHLRSKLDSRGLDVGSGMGRLLPWMASHCKLVTAVEPDPLRMQPARARLDSNLASRTSFLQQPVENVDLAERFDLVLCSHVLQHVRTADLPVILRKLRELSEPGGRAVLLTTHGHAEDDRFVKASVDGAGSFREDTIDPERFDQLVESPGDALPIRFFGASTLGAALRKAGFEVLASYVYHCCEGDFGDLEQHCFRDEIVNAVPALTRRFGRDIALVAKPV